jgi:hypothetical protein
MRGRPALRGWIAGMALLVVVAAAVSAAGTDSPESATEVPSSIPVNGVAINTQWVLMPTRPGDAPTLDRSQAIDIASKHRDPTLVPPTAILARVTVPGTIPPPDSPVPFRTIEDRLAWVVTFTFDKPENVASGKAGPNTGTAPPLWVKHYSAVLDADSGGFLIGFLT